MSENLLLTSSLLNFVYNKYSDILSIHIRRVFNCKNLQSRFCLNSETWQSFDRWGVQFASIICGRNNMAAKIGKQMNSVQLNQQAFTLNCCYIIVHTQTNIRCRQKKKNFFDFSFFNIHFIIFSWVSIFDNELIRNANIYIVSFRWIIIKIKMKKQENIVKNMRQ